MNESGGDLLLLGGLLVAGLLAVGFVLWLVILAFRGAAVLLALAAAQGFVGLVAFVAAWVFLLPVMLVAAIVVGFMFRAAEWRGSSDYRMRDRKAEKLKREAAMWRHKNLGEPLLPPKQENRNVPPDEPEERYKWANRLPPYDK